MTTMRMKSILNVTSAPDRHWVGDGFPVHGMFGYSGPGVPQRSPFLMLDYAAPTRFEPTARRRGVGSTRIAVSRPSPSSTTARSSTAIPPARGA